jgi:predicted TIM-barrel fold metal-dependent hydrolase
MSEPISFFDCNAAIGNPAAPIFGTTIPGPAELLNEMGMFGIDEALVVDVIAKELDYREGNERILSVLEPHDELWPVATTLPEFALHDDVEYLAGILDRGCRAVRIHPNALHEIKTEYTFGRMFPFHPDVVGPICEMLQARRVPLFVELDQVHWDEVYDICRQYPNLPLVLLNVTYRHKRSLFAGMNRYKNLYVDTSCYWVYRGVEEMCRVLGAERILFGTRLPVFNALSSVAMVMYARISEAERRAIAGDNLRHLLRNSEPGASTAALPTPDSSLGKL